MKLTPLQKARRKWILDKRVLLGLCRNCGDDAPNNFLCDRCHDRRIEKQRRARVRRKERGVCTVCKAPLEEGAKYYCHKCIIKKNGERECATDGCCNTAMWNRLSCSDCIERREAEAQSCNVYFIRCVECGNLYTTPRLKMYCSDECSRQSQMVNPINRECTICGNEYELNRGTNYDSACSNKCLKKKIQNTRRETKRRRKARLKNVIVVLFKDTEIFIRDGYKCHLCGRKLNPTNQVPHPRAPTIDHIIPVSRGGSHTRRNVKCACFICNSLKGDRLTKNGEQLLLFGT